VLFLLTVLLLQFFENFRVEQVEKQMTDIANKVANIIAEHPQDKKPYETAAQIIDVYAARGIVIKNNRTHWLSPNHNHLPNLELADIKKDPDLNRVFQTHKKVSKETRLYQKDDHRHENLVIVGVPMRLSHGKYGAVFIYEPSQIVNQSADEAKKLIYISVGIAIILTTIFAFFLSTRIAAPLREMRRAAQEVAEGKFDMKVPVVTNDEIGELGIAFNIMANQLKTNITALNQEKEQVSGILSSMADGVMTFDRDGNLLISNPPAKRLLHTWWYETYPDVTTSNTTAHLQDVPSSIKDLFDQVVNEEREQTAEVVLQGRTWMILMTALYDDDDQKVVRGAVAVFRDMTEERRLDKLRQGFIANVSHELRTPIALLQGYSEAIVDDVVDSEEQKREIGQIIYDESKRMGRLVNELLDLASLEAGHFQMNQTWVEVGDFFERITRKFQTLAKEQNIELVFAGSVQPHTVILMDVDRIEQVLTNLIDNAIRHTRDDGIVTVRVGENEQQLLVSINDTGVGIAEEDLPFVFERFYKADKARTRGKAGTGLGLAIAKNIVEAHKGHIIVQSKLGKGTTFTFSLPKTTAKS